MNHLEYRLGKQEDVAWLAEMNQQLIRDEKHRNRMTLSELEKRMSDFLRNQYSAVIVSCNQVDIGYHAPSQQCHVCQGHLRSVRNGAARHVPRQRQVK